MLDEHEEDALEREEDDGVREHPAPSLRSCRVLDEREDDDGMRGVEFGSAPRTRTPNPALPRKSEIRNPHPKPRNPPPETWTHV
jgi:hypothetical protein